MSILRIVEMLLVITSIMFIFWFAASYFDVIAHNLDPEPMYKSWNLFEILTNR